MKLVTLFLVIGFTQVIAKGYGQRMTIKESGVGIEDIFRIIESWGNYYFIYNKEELPREKKVYITIENGSIDDVLKQVLKGEPLDYKVFENTVVIRKRQTAALDEKAPRSETIAQQPRIIQGTVSDLSGQPLAGVGVSVKHTNRGTATDDDGNFTLETTESEVTLVISYLGFETQELPVKNNQPVNVQLVPLINELEEMVVVGYGTQKKVNLTGAVDVISNKQIENRQSATVSQILQGQSPGLNFSVNNDGFQPGASMNIDIRGRGSLNGGSPYILIDGFPGDMDRLNPNDIESISVLKDAAASAIYGARAPYGVILITTKSGKKNEKLSVSYSGNLSVNTPEKLPEMLDSYTFARVMNEMGTNAGGAPYTNEGIDRIIAYQKQDWDYLKQFMPDDATVYETIPLPNGAWGHNHNGYADYDWYDEYYGHSVNQRHNFSLQGGSEKTSYYLSSGYLGQEGVLNYGVDTYDRFNLSGKINTAITDWWDFRYETRFMKSQRERTNMDSRASSDYSQMFQQIARTVPTQPKYDGYGNLTIQSKIPWANDSGTDQIETTENWHTLATDIRPLPGWNIHADFAYRSVGLSRTNREFTIYEHMVDKSLIPSGNTVPSSIKQIQNNNFYWAANIFTSYEITINERHNVLALAGTQYEYNKARSLDGSKNDLIVPDVPSLETATGTAVLSESQNHWATRGYFGRLTYNYSEKYLFEANMRYDGTSRFRQGKRWGFFPSFSMGWNLDKEQFWNLVEPYVNTFKLRASWGQLGNQQVNPYSDLSLMPLVSGRLNWIFNYGEGRPIGYASAPAIVSPDLTWETATTKNIGVNLSFLKHRLHADFDYFERVTKRMIGPSEAKPGVLGAAVPSSNNATLRTRGWELSVTWNQQTSGALSYFLNANLYDSKTVVTKYLNPTGLLSSWYPGKVDGEIWGYTAYDLYRSQDELDAYLDQVDLSAISTTWNTGDVKYEDINGDGIVNSGSNTLNDHGDRLIIGNNTPRYQYGIGGGINYKGFDFSMLWKGTGKRDYIMNSNQYVFWGVHQWLFTSMGPQHLDYFRDQPGDSYIGLYEGAANINTDSYWPRPYLDGNQNARNRVAATRYLQDISYIRLQNAQIGYTFSQRFLSKLRLQQLRIFVSGENLATFTKLPKGIDPVAISGPQGVGMTYGADRIVSLGITATF